MRTDPAGVQSREELDSFYDCADPWDYDETPDDAARVARLLSALPRRSYERTLDIGCGNGFVTAHLPGREIVAVDLSHKAIAHATRRVPSTDDRKVSFLARSLFELNPDELGTFDLVVITGVLYPQYIGAAFSVATQAIRRLLANDAIVACVHIDEWNAHRLPLTTLHVSIDRYREFFHRLEIFQAVA
ncbi:MAG: methyltransferase domain-containing protein [Solirubrobacterales bacterium]|nr:methyltransferase domain-containing protein [Solirubrobacterales bacterium]